jgi:ssDNA-binding replication factor A large subunit
MEETNLIKEIAEKSGKPESEIKTLIDAKIKKFSGLLTEQGASFMVQKELGLKQEAGVESKVGELSDGMKGIDLTGEIKAIFPVKEFEKNGKTGKLKSFILTDDTGEVRITLWNDQVEKYDLSVGSKIKILNGIVSAYNEKKQVGLGFNGEVEIIEKKELSFDDLSNLKAGMNNINVVGRLLRKYPCKEFDSNDRKGKLCNFQFGDGTALLRATAWNEKTSDIDKYNEGDTIQITNGYTKDGMFGVELHLGYNAELKNSEKEMPSVTQMLSESVTEKKINQLVENENTIISGKIKNIKSGNLFYPVCEKCGKKVSLETSGVICDKCGEVQGEKRAIVGIEIEDDTGKLSANLFGNEALKAIKLDKDSFEKEIEEKSSETLVEELNEKLIGSEIKLFGYEKNNSYSGENEFSVKEVL